MTVPGHLDSYKNTMYESSLPPNLRTGDVVRLKLEDFQKIVRHEPILAVFKQFAEIETYSECLWAILNQPCDLVHDLEQQRTIKSNLFIAPLVGLKVALKKEMCGRLLHLDKLPKVTELFQASFKSFFHEKTRKETVRAAGEVEGTYWKRVKSTVDTAVGKIAEIIKDGEGQFQDLQDVLSSLKEMFSVEAPAMAPMLDEFEKHGAWKGALEKYEGAIKEIESKNKAIILADDEQKRDTLAKLCNNQLDRQGIFFYEPSKSISTEEGDLAYVIQLQDMLTVKIKAEALTSGQLFELLKSTRKLSLTENFSDRLLNIMGNYFSKIGTQDVHANRVLELYSQVYPDKFFLTPKQFEARGEPLK